jgi:hypothetical protein
MKSLMIKELLEHKTSIDDESFFDHVQNAEAEKRGGRLRDRVVEQKRLNREDALALKYGNRWKVNARNAVLAREKNEFYDRYYLESEYKSFQ